MRVKLRLSLDAASLPKVVHAIMASSWMHEYLPAPDRLDVDNTDVPVSEDWKGELCSPVTHARAAWVYPEKPYLSRRVLRVDAGLVVKFNAQDIETSDVLATMAEWPFDVATLSSWHSHVWEPPLLEKQYRAPRFGNGHHDLGWACLFRGEEGHRRLVSRRWLDFGPWRVLRGPHDTTMVQFHDVDADARTALEQAMPGHHRMADTSAGGIIDPLFELASPFNALYVSDERKLRVICHEGRVVTPGEMLDACTVLFHNNTPPERFARERADMARIVGHREPPHIEGPVDSVAFVFITEEDARAHLHDLWLRGLECWAFIEGKEVRLDLDYHPEPPPKPAWVQALDG
jgi:hypothetical protein